MPPIPDITPAEWAVMEALWKESPLTAQEVFTRLEGSRDWSLGTVKTLLSRLAKKGAARFEAQGNRYHYRPAVSRRACVRAAGKDLLKRAKGEAKSPLLAFFLKESRLDLDEISELRALLDDLEERQQ